MYQLGQTTMGKEDMFINNKNPAFYISRHVLKYVRVTTVISTSLGKYTLVSHVLFSFSLPAT